MKAAPKIIFEDDQILVLNKPPGVVVNRAESVKEGSLQDWLDDYLSLRAVPQTEATVVFLARSGLCHRLDRDTSGCLLVAKTPGALDFLLKQFKERKVEKTYLALVHGRFEPRQGTIRLPISRDIQSRQKWRVHYLGKDAQTSWEVMQYYRHGSETLTLVKLFPKTGRTHQIRVHLTHLGHPLVADSRYLRSSRVREDQALLSRHFLHALTLGITHPTSHERRLFEAPLTPDLQAVLDQLTPLN